MRNSYLAGLGLSAVAALGLPLATGALANAAPLPAAHEPAHIATHAKRVTHTRPAATHHNRRVVTRDAHPAPVTHATHESPVTHVARLTAATQPLTYTVQPGDSLWTIAHAHHVDWFNLAADNHLEMYNVIVPGQVLRLPPAGEAPHAPMPLDAPAPAPAPAATSEAPAASSADQAAPVETTPVPTTETASPAPTTAAPQPTSGFEQCVISRESGGNPDATNGSGHWGLFQFSASTWSAYGGNPADFGSASSAEQQQVFNNAVAAGGASNWAPYDGC